MKMSLPKSIEDLYAPHVDVTPATPNSTPLEQRPAYCNPNTRKADLERAERLFGKRVKEGNRQFYRDIIQSSLSREDSSLDE